MHNFHSSLPYGGKLLAQLCPPVEEYRSGKTCRKSGGIHTRPNLSTNFSKQNRSIQPKFTHSAIVSISPSRATIRADFTSRTPAPSAVPQQVQHAYSLRCLSVVLLNAWRTVGCVATSEDRLLLPTEELVPVPQQLSPRRLDCATSRMIGTIGMAASWTAMCAFKQSREYPVKINGVTLSNYIIPRRHSGQRFELTF